MAEKSLSYVLANVSEEVIDTVTTQMKSRAERATHQLRNAKIEVMRGNRSGRVYRIPSTGATYRASAPGEPPAKRTGAFSSSMRRASYAEGSGKNLTVHATLQSKLRVGGKNKVLLSQILEEGTGKMAPRPYKEAILKIAKPKITKIFKEPYL